VDKIAVTAAAVGNILEITPADGILDNSKYTIRIKGLKSADGTKILPEKVFTIVTAITPMYCTLNSLKALVDSFGVPEANLLSYIRNASREADFIAGGTAVKKGKAVPFEVEQFVRTRATIDCLTRACMDKTLTGGGMYRLGDASLEDSTNSNAFRNMIKLLQDDLKKWQDAIRGYYNEGRVAPKATRIGLKSSSNSDVSQITVDNILNDISRTMPQWS